MRIALVGWDLDTAIAGALSGWGADVVAWTRWFPDQLEREDREGWRLERCPHRLVDGAVAEALTFREAVLDRHATSGAVEFDVVHALDAMARPAAEGLLGRSPGGLGVVSVTAEDVRPESVTIMPVSFALEICDHPWTADRWMARGGGDRSPSRLVVVPGAALTARPARPWTALEAVLGEEPLLVAWVPRNATLDPEGVAEAVALARRNDVPSLSAVVLGAGPLAEMLRRGLRTRGLLLRLATGVCDPTLERWSAWLAAATVVGVTAPQVTSDPAAWVSWCQGRPVVGLGLGGSRALAEAIGEAVGVRGRYERDVHIGAALASWGLRPSGIAWGWLRAYLDALAAPAGFQFEGMAAPPPRLAGSERSRLALVALSPHELYASWYARPDDHATALDWMGPDAIRSTLVLRFQDITDLRFHGTNAHAIWDVELAPGERHRTMALGASGRSLVATLGVRSSRGYFHPLAHAGPVHLPREGQAPEPEPPGRRLRALPRHA